jgi:WD40 repeat protein
MNAITCNEAGDRVLTGGHDRKLRIFRRTGEGLAQEAEVLIGEGPINTIRVATHPGYEGQAFVGCYSGAIVRVSREGRILGSFRVHGNAVKALRLHPRKCLGVSCSAEGILASWEFGGRLVRTFPGHLGIIDDVDLDPSGTWLASVGRDFTLKVYRLDDGQLSHSISLGRRSPKGVCFVDEATVVVTTYWGELLKVTLPDRRVHRRQVARNGISSVARIGRHLAASSYDGAVYLVRPEDLAVEQTLQAMTQRVDGAGWN